MRCNRRGTEGAASLQVTLFDSTSCSAKIVGADENKDIAVLRLDLPPAEAAGLRRVSVGRSAGLAVGQKVFAIGNPFGLDHTLTSVRTQATPRPRGCARHPCCDPSVVCRVS